MSDTTFLISGGFFDAVDSDRLYSADQMNQPYKKLIHDGINREADGTTPGFAVTAGGGMNVLVATGNAMIGGKWAENKAVQTIAVAGNTSGSARIDSIILQCDKSRAVRAVQIVYRQGTTAAPDLVSDDDITELRLANIRVPSAASAIASENITDTRGGAECPWVRSVFDAPDARYIVEEYTGTELAGAYQTVKSAVDSIRYAAQSGQPTVALQASDMIDSNLVYLYQGSETGYSTGYLYYYSDAAGAWIRGAQYGASVVDTALDEDSENPVQNKAIAAAIKTVRSFVVEVPGSAAVFSGSIAAGDFAKALATYTAGSGVYAVKDGEVYQLSAADSSTMTFTQMYHGTMNIIKQLQITSADTFTVTNTALSSSAADTSYNNTTSGLTATNVQAAIDENAAALTEVNGRLQQDEAKIGDLSQLQTEDKTDLVSAINEAAQTGGGTGGDSVPVNVRQAIYDLFSTALYDSDSEKYPNLQSNLTILSTWIEAVTAINLVPRSLMLNAVGLTSQLSATTVPAGGTITWVSSDTDVATVSDSGLVTTTGFGSCTITATSGAVSESCSVVVSAKTLVSIDAVYTPSGKVYTTDSLDVLKPKLAVTAHWSDSSTSAVSPNDYVLSGTLTKGTSAITVSYGGKTDTVSVTVTGLYTVTNNLTNATTSNNATTAEDGAAYTATLTAGSGFSAIVATVTMGGVDITSTAYNNRVISIPNVAGNIEITAYGASAYLYDYPFNGTIAGRGRADLGLHTYTTGTQAKFANDGAYDFLYGTSADDVLVADTPSGFVLDGDFTISIYGAAEYAKANNMFGWSKYLGTDMIPTKYNVVDSQTYSPTSGRRSKVACGINIFTDGNGLNTNLCNSDLTYGANIYNAPAKAECWDNAWHHYCLQRDNGTITMYFDKTPVWTIETTDTLYLGDKLAIGGVWSYTADDGTFRAYNTSQVPTHYDARIRNLVIDDSAIDINTL